MRGTPPPLRALMAQALALLLLALALRLSPAVRGPGALLLQGFLALGLGRAMGLSFRWTPVHFALPWVILAFLRHPPPFWVLPALLLALLSVYGGGLLTRVPLYHSNRAAWKALEDLLPPGPASFVDLGAGLGGPVAHLARRRPEGRFLGVEASPLTALAAWLRTLPCPNGRIRWRSLWAQPLQDQDLVFAFLSPAPMDRLWAKASREMKAGSLFVSHTFEVPGQTPDRKLPLPGRKDACLLIWRMRGPEATVSGNAPADPDRSPG